MTDTYQDVVWSPPVRPRDSLVSPSRDLVVVPPLKGPQRPAGVIHPAVYPSFRTPETASSATAIDLPPGAYSMIIHKPSLFLLGFGLMLLGVCFFSSGFFLGMWIGGRSAGPSSAQVASVEGGSSSGGGSGASSSRFGTFLGLAGTAVGGKAGRLAFAGQRAANKEARQQARSGGGGGAAATAGPAGGAGAAAEEADFHHAEETAEAEEGSGSISNITYAIQLGSFAAKENAQDLLTRLKEAQFSAYLVESKDADGGPIFCVRSGKFRRFNLAETGIGKFSGQGLSAIVVAIKSTDKPLMQ